MKKIINSTILTFIILTNFLCQAQVDLDSLWNVWNDETESDTSRALALFKISWDGYLYSQPDSAFYFAQMLFDFANKKNLMEEMSLAKKTQGASCFIRSNYPKAIELYQQSLAISKEISDKSGMASNLGNIGLVYERKGYYLKALDYQQRCLDIKEEISDTLGIAAALNNIGNIYKNLENYPKAMEYYKRFYVLIKKLSHISGMAMALNNIGLAYKNLGDLPKALEYYQQSLKVNKEIPDKRGMAHTLNNIGNVYKEQDDYLKALEYYKKSLKIKEEISDKRGMVNTLNNIGNTYYMLGDHTTAISWCEKGFNISEEINILEGQKKACQCLYDVHKTLGNTNKALEYHERVTLLNDSLQAKETSKKLQQMEFKRQMREDSLVREKEKLSVQIAHEKELRRKKRTRNIYLIVAAIFLLVAVGFYRRILFVRKAKKAIEYEKNRSDHLLLNILPEEIAEELKEKGSANARNYDRVSILFTDFKGFTQISEKLSAEELVKEINTCFKAFDVICKKYNVEKIKTIGDSYMAAGGLPVHTEKSIKNTVLAGIEMAEFIFNRKQKQKNKDEIRFEMRLGIHTGSVVAGIVGETKFQYDIWGDAVNIASSMENSGKAGKVNISKSTYELIKEDPTFKFESRGEVKTRDKGIIEMWFVENAT